MSSTPMIAPRVRVIDVPKSSDGYVDVPCSIWCRRMDIEECPPASTYTGSYTKQGLNYQRQEDAYTAVLPLIAGEVLRLGNQIAEGNAFGQLVGKPVQTNHYGQTLAADIPVKITSATDTATHVRVTEYS